MDRRSWQGRRERGVPAETEDASEASVFRLRYTSDRGHSQGRGDAVVKMRQSLADWERAFVREITLDRHRRASLQKTTQQRALKREVHRRKKRGSARFAMLVLMLILTAVIVTVVMFRTLYLLLG
jgi:hypothetical protein